MSALLRLAELNAAYAAAIDQDRLEAWPDFFTDDCLYKITSAENHNRGYDAGIVYADFAVRCFVTGLPLCVPRTSTSVRLSPYHRSAGDRPPRRYSRNVVPGCPHHA